MVVVVVECSELRSSVSLILSLPPFPPAPLRLPQGGTPGTTWPAGECGAGGGGEDRGPVIGGREGKSERPEEREV